MRVCIQDNVHAVMACEKATEVSFALQRVHITCNLRLIIA